MKIINEIHSQYYSYRIVKTDGHYFVQKLGFLIGWHDVEDGMFKTYYKANLKMMTLIHTTT